MYIFIYTDYFVNHIDTDALSLLGRGKRAPRRPRVAPMWPLIPVVAAIALEGWLAAAPREGLGAGLVQDHGWWVLPNRPTISIDLGSIEGYGIGTTMLHRLRHALEEGTMAPGAAARSCRAVAFGASLLAGLMLANAAKAAGFATARFGGEHGSVVATNPTALYYNPGALGFSDDVHLMAEGMLALRSVTWVHAPAGSDPADPVGGEGANAGKAELFNVFGAPMLAASARLGQLSLAAGLFVPFGGRLTWDQNPAFVGHPQFPLAADGVQRWHSIKGSVAFIYGSVGAAYRFGRLSFGAGANLVVSSVESLRAKNLAGDTLGHTDQEGRVEAEVSGLVGSFGLGVMFEALEKRLWLGASYQAQPGLGPMTLKGTLVTTYGARRTDDVALHQALPDVIRAGARYRAGERTELRLFGEYTRWSVMRTQCLALADYPCAVTQTGADPGSGGIFQNFRRYWRDTVAVRAGVSRWFSPELELYLGTGFETAAIPAETMDPELPDSETLQGALGGRWEAASTWFVGASYTHLYYLPRDTTGKSRTADADVPTRRPDAGGQYTQWIGLINASLEKVF